MSTDKNDMPDWWVSVVVIVVIGIAAWPVLLAIGEWLLFLVVGGLFAFVGYGILTGIMVRVAAFLADMMNGK